MAVEKVENIYLKSRFVGQCFVEGDSLKVPQQRAVSLAVCVCVCVCVCVVSAVVRHTYVCGRRLGACVGVGEGERACMCMCVWEGERGGGVVEEES